jgi:very-short-patch-repair endonuclease
MPIGVYERTPAVRKAHGMALRISAAAIAQRARLHLLNTGRRASDTARANISIGKRASTKTAAYLVRLHASHVGNHEIGAAISAGVKRNWSSMTHEERKARTAPWVAAGQAISRHMRRKQVTGIECVLREALLPALLPRRRILPEHEIKCPADFRTQLTYRVDAYMPALRLVCEADGDYWHGLPDVKVRDFYKDQFLRADGFTVVHFLGSELNAWANGRDPGAGFWAKIDTILGARK